ncbi:MAG: lysophospholipid acyltransferase family protein [Thermoanaerobaculaceae bacterium]|nr:lysophospholipid acyltransferase family protein [Thermoanaerobaculaceae bacterium]MDI9622214.1 lysophospholipid acyltransferase family protein [Acidobacteriota bacterium]NLH12593.1 lysophospholipid acyltransferase family protein [Holophagae bacterium]HPW54937.1 lysophospholipid acyltransferase family protein [Thermoanaerobaculaceae bacterium]
MADEPMTVRHHLEYAGLMAVAATLRALPRPLALEVGAAIGALGWALRVRRRLVLSNLVQALPALSHRERCRLAARAARNFGRVVAEFVRFAGRDRTRLRELVALHGTDCLRAALERGQGAIVVTAHLGSWALYVTALAEAGIPSALLVGKQHNRKVDDFILSIPGEAVHFISKGRASPRDILRSLKDNRAVVMVADQHSGPRGEVAPFLGRPASTLPLPGALAARQGTPIFVLAGHRVTRGTHRVEITPLERPPSGEEATLRHEITVRCNEALGAAILAHPDQYFWYHRRWRGEQG